MHSPDDPKDVTLSLVVRADQEQLLRFLSPRLGVSLAAIVRWALDDARPFLLTRASLKESDLPAAARLPNSGAEATTEAQP